MPGEGERIRLGPGASGPGLGGAGKRSAGKPAVRAERPHGRNWCPTLGLAFCACTASRPGPVEAPSLVLCLTGATVSNKPDQEMSGSSGVGNTQTPAGPGPESTEQEGPRPGLVLAGILYWRRDEPKDLQTYMDHPRQAIGRERPGGQGDGWEKREGGNGSVSNTLNHKNTFKMK